MPSEGATVSFDTDEPLSEIDIEINGYRFSTIPRLNEYIHDEWPDEPDINIEGVVKI